MLSEDDLIEKFILKCVNDFLNVTISVRQQLKNIWLVLHT